MIIDPRFAVNMMVMLMQKDCAGFSLFLTTCRIIFIISLQNDFHTLHFTLNKPYSFKRFCLKDKHFIKNYIDEKWSSY